MDFIRIYFPIDHGELSELRMAYEYWCVACPKCRRRHETIMDDEDCITLAMMKEVADYLLKSKSCA